MRRNVMFAVVVEVDDAEPVLNDVALYIADVVHREWGGKVTVHHANGAVVRISNSHGLDRFEPC